MDSLERNHEEWERIRARADSLANAVFLIAGGALSVSISVMVSAKKSGVVPEAASSIATTGWYCLLAAIIHASHSLAQGYHPEQTSPCAAFKAFLSLRHLDGRPFAVWAGLSKLCEAGMPNASPHGWVHGGFRQASPRSKGPGYEAPNHKDNQKNQ